ncbi:phytanoyl-CoA dioxygenase family protein [Chloroflexi bacterium TSY]|nr:phytanoyl-CoA dioxygenase family protein [Chloroflexi bacterium TSY]
MRTMFNTALTPDQLAQYETDGYLLVSGLIAEPIAEKAEAAMWNLMRMKPDDPQTWTQIPAEAEYHEARRIVIFNGVTDPDLLACATPEYLLATAQVIGEDVESLHPPQAIHTQNLLPVETERPKPHAHVDGIPREHKHRTFSGPYRVASLVYLSDIEPGGGGTVVWPGSRERILALAESDRKKYTYLYDLNRDIPTLDLGEPIELLPKRGDVLFFQHLFGHNGTPNTGTRPRLMMRYFCACEACGRWKKTDSWNHWTP